MRGWLVALVAMTLLAFDPLDIEARPIVRPLVCARTVGQTRAQAGHNPGALRPRIGQPWPGQVSVDIGPGGPFAVFDTDQAGWLALHLWLLDAYHIRGLMTVRAIVSRFAPPDENNTASYVATIARTLHVSPDTTIDVDDAATRFVLAEAIALREGWYSRVSR